MVMCEDTEKRKDKKSIEESLREETLCNSYLKIRNKQNNTNGKKNHSKEE